VATVTFLFVDQVGSTAQLEALGDVAGAEVRDEYFRLLRAALAAHAGSEVDHTGDGVMATFTSAVDATSCAIAMQRKMYTHNRGLARDRALEIRIGIHTGEPVLNEEGRNFGLPVVVASRLCAAAQSGQILASDVTRVLAGAREHLHFRPVDALTLKGVAEPVAAAEVVWDPPDPEADRWPLPPMLAAVGDFAFVGRDRELDVLRAAWSRAKRGERAAVLLAGEPGIGKTRLAAELAGEVRASGGRVLFGWCDDELGVPYQPFVESLRQFVAHVPPHALPRELGRYAGDLARLVPEIDAHDLSALRSDPETERYRLFEAVASWLAAAASDEPVLLVLDDLHWAAKPTLLMLQHVVRATEPARLLVVGTYRDTELGRTHPLAGVLAELRRGAGPERLAVAGLDAAEVTAFLEAATGHELDDASRALALVIHAETEGNAFFMTEVVRHLAESGAVVQRDGRWTTDRAIADIGIPEGVREVVGRRLSRLSGATDDVLALAAVIGREYELGLLDAAGEHDEAVLLAALDEAVTARLVDERAPGCYRFTHALVRSTLYDELRPTRRARLHRRVAEALERLDDGRVAELAHHYAQASAGGDTSKAVEYATRAGDQALAQLAHDEAAVFYSRAVEMLDGAPSAPLAQRCDLVLALGTAQRRAGDAAHKATLLEAARLAEVLGDGERAARAALENSRQWGWSVTGGIDEERVTSLETALEMLGPGQDEMRARLLGNLSTELVFEEDPRRRVELSDQALAVARRSGDPATLARVLHLRLVAVQGIAPREERYALVSEALALASELSDPVLTGFPTVNRAALAVEDGDLALADELLAAALPIAEDLHIPGMLWLVLSWLPVLAMTRGAFDDAEGGLNESLVLGQAADQPDAIMMFASQLFCLRFLQGRVAELEEMMVQSVVAGIGPGGPAADCLLAVLYSELGRMSEARAAFDQSARDDFARFPSGYLYLGMLAFSAETCARLGDARRAAVLFGLLEPRREPFVVLGPTCFGATSRYLGLAATTSGRFDEADAAFAAASDLHERAGARPWLARTQVDWARMRLARDGSGAPAARSLLERALATTRELGMASTGREAATLLDGIAAR
jgi:class 3 adenylate cyclase/tetratricopeptide (TPR) repeat protein